MDIDNQSRLLGLVDAHADLNVSCIIELSSFITNQYHQLCDIENMIYDGNTRLIGSVEMLFSFK
jgi:hypothetical protein